MKKKIKIILSLCVLLSIVFNSFSASATEAKGAWIEKNKMPANIAGAAIGEVNGKVYVIGGISSSSSDLQKTVYEYNPTNDSWSKKNDMPSARSAMTAATVNGKIYVFGGYTGNGYTMTGGTVLNSVSVYDPATDSWDTTTKTVMPVGKAWASAVTYGNEIYLVGGINSSVQTLATVEAYNTVSNTWTSKASMPTALHAVGLAVLNEKIYAIGGGNGITSYNTVTEYDPATNVWSTKANLHTAKDASGVAVLNGIIYSFGGGDTSGKALGDVEAYDPLTNKWDTLS